MKIGFLFVGCLLLSINLRAQLCFGIKGGLNLSDVVINNTTDNPDAEADFRTKAGLNAGIYSIAEIGLRKALTVEVLYSNKGVKVINNINLHYISLPVLLRFDVTDKFIAEAGPELSYLIVAKSKYGNIGNIWNNNLDLGLDLGVAYLFSSRVSAGVRFNAGFSSVIRDSGSTSAGSTVRYQNRVLQLTVAYRLLTVDLRP